MFGKSDKPEEPPKNPSIEEAILSPEVARLFVMRANS